MLAAHAQNHERASGCLSEERRKSLAIQSDNSMQRIQHTWQGWHSTPLISVFEFAASAVCCRWDLYEIKPSIFNEGELSRCREQMSRRGIWMFAGQNKSQASQKCVTQRPFSFFVKLGCLKKICRVTSSDMAVASSARQILSYKIQSTFNISNEVAIRSGNTSTNIILLILFEISTFT